MLARLLTRRVVMAGTPLAATDPTQLAEHRRGADRVQPAAGAVFGIELMRMGHLAIYADDGSQPCTAATAERPRDTEAQLASLVDTARGTPAEQPPPQNKRAQTQPPVAASGEINVKSKTPTTPPPMPSLAKGSVPPPRRRARPVRSRYRRPTRSRSPASTSSARRCPAR